MVKNAKARSRKIGFYLILNLHVLHLLNCYSKKLLNFTMLKVKMCGHKSCIVMSRLLTEMCVTCLHMHKMYYICEKLHKQKQSFRRCIFRLIKGSFQSNSIGVRNQCSQIFFKFLPFICFYERSIA